MIRQTNSWLNPWAKSAIASAVATVVASYRIEYNGAPLLYNGTEIIWSP